jgi:hypothetical protein
MPHKHDWPPNQYTDDLLRRCRDAENRGVTRFRGMSYEQGVLYGIQWMLGQEDFDPLEGPKLETPVPVAPFGIDPECAVVIAREYLKAKGLCGEIVKVVDGVVVAGRVVVSSNFFEWKDVWVCYQNQVQEKAVSSNIVIIAKVDGQVLYWGNAGEGGNL